MQEHRLDVGSCQFKPNLETHSNALPSVCVSVYKGQPQVSGTLICKHYKKCTAKNSKRKPGRFLHQVQYEDTCLN